jgi:universal stress protein A
MKTTSPEPNPVASSPWLDFSGPSLEALRHAVTLARQNEAQLTLVHAIEPFHADLLPDTSQVQRQVRQAAHQRLERFFIEARRLWPRTTRELRAGHPVAVITRPTRRAGAEFIVMGGHGRNGLKRGLIGSVAERVVRHAPCPLPVVR